MCVYYTNLRFRLKLHVTSSLRDDIEWGMPVTQQKIKQHILIADDDTSITDLLSDLLNEVGYIVDCVHTGTEVLERLKDPTSYQLVLMDVKMPGLDGLEVLEQIRQKSIDLPVIMITGYGASSVAIRAMQMGAYDYLNKPFNLDEVLLVVKRVF